MRPMVAAGALDSCAVVSLLRAVAQGFCAQVRQALLHAHAGGP